MKLKYSTLKRIQDVWEKLGGEEGVDKFLSGEIVFQRSVSNSILRCISDGAGLVIPACDGRRTLAKAKEVFKSYIDPDFKKCEFDKRGNPTKETAVMVHEMVRHGTFVQGFCSFGVDLVDMLCLTQHQIEVFCANFSDWLRTDGGGTFFLTKKDWRKSATIGNLFVADVRMNSVGLGVYESRFEYDYVLSPDDHHRLVVQQLET